MPTAKSLSVPVYSLIGGAKMPALGIGTFESDEEEKVTSSVEHALKCGYRLIDTACHYGTEAPTGEGIKKSGVPRKDIFVTSKLWNNDHLPARVPKALESSLQRLDLKYLDMYMIHWPVAFRQGDDEKPTDANGVVELGHVPIDATWKAMERLLESGKTRSLGVSNFEVEPLKRIIEECNIVPAVNQIEFHPYYQRSELVSFCVSNGIRIQAYAPFGNLNADKEEGGRLIDDPVLRRISDKYGVNVTTIILSWDIKKGISAIPKSTNPSRIKQNLEIISLDDEDIQEIDKLDKGKRYIKPEVGWGHPNLDVFTDV